MQTLLEGFARLGVHAAPVRSSVLDRDGATAERDRFVRDLQREGRYIDELTIDKR